MDQGALKYYGKALLLALLVIGLMQAGFYILPIIAVLLIAYLYRNHYPKEKE